MEGTELSRGQFDDWLTLQMRERDALKFCKRFVPNNLQVVPDHSYYVRRVCRHAPNCRSNWNASATMPDPATMMSTFQVVVPACCFPATDNDTGDPIEAPNFEGPPHPAVPPTVSAAAAARPAVPRSIVRRSDVVAVPPPPPPTVSMSSAAADGGSRASIEGTHQQTPIPVVPPSPTHTLRLTPPAQVTQEWIAMTMRHAASNVIPCRTLAPRFRAVKAGSLKTWAFAPCRCTAQPPCDNQWRLQCLESNNYDRMQISCTEPTTHVALLEEIGRYCSAAVGPADAAPAPAPAEHHQHSVVAVSDASRAMPPPPLPPPSRRPAARRAAVRQSAEHHQPSEESEADASGAMTCAAASDVDVAGDMVLRSDAFMTDNQRRVALNILRTSGGRASASDIVRTWVEQGLVPIAKAQAKTKMVQQCLRRSRHASLLPAANDSVLAEDFFARLQLERSGEMSIESPTRLMLLPDAQVNVPDNLLFMPLMCHRFVQAASKTGDRALCFVTDGKWKCLRDNWVFTSIGFLARSQVKTRASMARVSVPGFKVARLQSNEYTTQFVPCMAAIMKAEGNLHMTLLNSALQRNWPRGHFPELPLQERMVQLHKDYAPSIEHGRQEFFPNARPIGDWPHFVRNMTAKSKKAGIGALQVKNVHQLAYATRLIPTVELFSALWTHQFEYYGHQQWQTLLSTLQRHYFREFKVRELGQMLGVRLLRGHESSDTLMMADWFQGVFSQIPGTASGTQSVEAYHRAWDNHIGKRSAAYSPDVAIETYQRFVSELMSSSDYESHTPTSLHGIRHDPRQFRVNGLVQLGEITALDLWVHRARGNHVLVPSESFPATCYLVFNRTASPQQMLTTYNRDHAAAVARMREAGRMRSRLQMTRQNRGDAATLTGHDFTRIASEMWRAEHPASRPVDPTVANTAIELLELVGDALQNRLRALGILPARGSAEVDVVRLAEHVLSCEVVTMGSRAKYPDASHNAILCSCQRFSNRGSCAHTVFAETLTVPGIRAATIDNMGQHVLTPAPALAAAPAADAVGMQVDGI